MRFRKYSGIMAKIMTLTETIRKAIKQADETRYRIAKGTGISEAVLSRFVNGKGNLAGKNIDVLCNYLGLKLTQRKAKHGNDRK